MNYSTPKDKKHDEWMLGAKNRRAGFSLSQSYKHINRYDHDVRRLHVDGWQSMDRYLFLKQIDEEYAITNQNNELTNT
jgi:hypothetical protein